MEQVDDTAWLVPVAAFVGGLLATLLLVAWSVLWPGGARHRGEGPQNLHGVPADRIGGVGLLAGLAAGLGVAQATGAALGSTGLPLLLAALPIFLAGLKEDLSRGMSPPVRLLAAMAASLLGAGLLDIRILETDLPLLDALLPCLPVSLALTAFAVTGVTHAVNLIDGCHGLAAGSMVLILGGLGWVAHELDDEVVRGLACTTAAAALGFMAWNYPSGRIFLGDCGAYLLGFLAAELGLLLTLRHEVLSPLFPLVLCAYPVIETVFSMWRRHRHRPGGLTRPDSLHLHSLLYREQLMRLPRFVDEAMLRKANAHVAPRLWGFCGLCVAMALLSRHNSPAALGSFVLLVTVYLHVYRHAAGRLRAPDAESSARPLISGGDDLS